MFPRTLSRFAAIQGVCQHFYCPEKTLEVIQKEFETHRFTPHGYRLFEDEEPMALDVDFFKHLMKGVQDNRGKLDVHIGASLPMGWSLRKMEHGTHSIFLCAGFELLKDIDTPKQVIFNEYLNAAHSFLLKKGPGFVNALLEKLCERLRKDTTQEKKTLGDLMNACEIES